jgi:hypothetical protein
VQRNVVDAHSLIDLTIGRMAAWTISEFDISTNVLKMIDLRVEGYNPGWVIAPICPCPRGRWNKNITMIDVMYTYKNYEDKAAAVQAAAVQAAAVQAAAQAKQQPQQQPAKQPAKLQP